MDFECNSFSGRFLPISPLRAAAGVALCGMVMAVAPVAPAAQEAATRTTNPNGPAQRAVLASSSVEAQSGSGRASEGRVGLAEIESTRAALIEAATDDAVHRLYEQISAEPAGRSHRIADVLKALPIAARMEFRAALRRSPQVGGPRFADVSTTQVHLQARGQEVGRVLVEIVTEYRDQSPVSPEVLSRALDSWSTRSFYGVGGSVRPEVAELLRPRYVETQSKAWEGVDSETTRQTINAAHDNAIEQVVVQMKRVTVEEALPATDGPSAASTDPGANGAADSPDGGAPEHPQTLGDLIEARNLEDPLRVWLADRPIMRLRFGENRDVAIRISVGADDIVAFLALNGDPGNGEFTGPAPLNEEQWRVIERRLADALPETLAGSAMATAPPPVDVAPKLTLATTPPEWARAPVSATGTATGGDRLVLYHRAHDLARENLRQTLMELTVGEGITLADLAEQRPEVGQLVDRAVRSARTSSEYEGNALVTVHATVSGVRLWRVLSR